MLNVFLSLGIWISVQFGFRLGCGVVCEEQWSSLQKGQQARSRQRHRSTGGTREPQPCSFRNRLSSFLIHAYTLNTLLRGHKIYRITVIEVVLKWLPWDLHVYPTKMSAEMRSILNPKLANYLKYSRVESTRIAYGSLGNIQWLHRA